MSERIDCFTKPLLLAMMLMAIILATSTKDITQELGIVYKEDLLEHILCTIDEKMNSITSAVSMTLFESKPCSHTEFRELAIIDIWSAEPLL
ncbi:hypothetical protein PoB_002698800, partial [Plakobranchus ocellatus]